MNFDEIEQDARCLIDEYSNQISPITNPPVPVDKIADLYLDLSILYEDLDEETSGSINLNTGLITINQNDPLRRQRFFLGHEVGHYRLHRGEFDFQTLLLPIFAEESTIICRKDDSSRRETEANVFSASLIMPRTLIDPIFQSEKRRTPKNIAEQVIIRILADKFQVSRDAMRYRLQNLGYFADMGQKDLFSVL